MWGPGDRPGAGGPAAAAPAPPPGHFPLRRVSARRAPAQATAAASRTATRLWAARAMLAARGLGWAGAGGCGWWVASWFSLRRSSLLRQLAWGNRQERTGAAGGRPHGRRPRGRTRHAAPAGSGQLIARLPPRSAPDPLSVPSRVHSGPCRRPQRLNIVRGAGAGSQGEGAGIGSRSRAAPQPPRPPAGGSVPAVGSSPCWLPSCPGRFLGQNDALGAVRREPS